MVQINTVGLGYGDVVFTKAFEGRPRTEKREGNVTVINEAIAGKPAYFEVSHMLNVEVDADGDTYHNIFHLKSRISGEDEDVSYKAIEALGFRNLAPMLRAIADRIEADEAERAAARREAGDDA